MSLAGFLIEHGGILILPLAVIEGPIVSVVSGILAAQGYLDWYWVLCLLVAGDLIGDAICYFIGRSGGTPLGRLVKHLGPRVAVSPELRAKLRRSATKMLVLGKWTHSIGWLVLVGSGMLRLSFARFMLVNLLATVPKSAVLLGVGYFAGDYYPFFESHYALTTALLCVAGMTGMVVILKRNGLWTGRGAP